MRHDWGMNGQNVDWRAQDMGRSRDDERGGSMRGRDADRGWYEQGGGGRGGGWSSRDQERGGREQGGWSGREQGGGGGRDQGGWSGRDRGGWSGREQERGWSPRDQESERGGMRGQRGMRGDDEMQLQRGEAPLVKVIEVVAQSPHSWEDATRRALAEASRTIDDIKSIYVKDMQAIVANGRIVEFRLVAKVSFAIRGESRTGRSSGQRDYA
ncbi:MAG: dodecin family protein [Myxococcota bacterium]|nr:dodecin family protein [Myxococcota bacterium]